MPICINHQCESCNGGIPCPNGCCDITSGKCGECPAFQTCGGGGIANVCGCVPVNPCTEGVCGSVRNNCGQEVICGTCPAPEITSFTATPQVIAAGGASTLAWTSNHATACAINNGVGNVPCNGSTSVTPLTSTAYLLSASGLGVGVATRSAIVTVQP